MAASIVQNMIIVGGAGGGGTLRLMHVTPDAVPVPFTPRAIVAITDKPVSKMVMQSGAPVHSVGLVWIEVKSVAVAPAVIGEDGARAVELIRAWISTGTDWVPVEAWHSATGQWVLFSTAILPLPTYTYTGNSTLIDDGGGNWRIKFLTSGTLTLADKRDIDVFLVGGGGGGARGNGNYKGGGGGGGGLIKTIYSATLMASQGYQITVGGGGSGGTSAAGGVGGTSTFLSYSAVGGNGGNGGETQTGGSGASGGGGGSYAYGPIAGDGGSNGSNGSGSTGSYSAVGGTGSGVTTREFGVSSSPLYSGGGGGGAGRDTGGSNGQAGNGGNGGGGKGGSGVAGIAGTTNLGGGGGGGGYLNNGGAGGSGIVIIRNARG